MKISVFTRELQASKSTSEIKKAAEIASNEKADLLILPGYYPCNSPSSSFLQKIKEISSQNNLNILSEVAINKKGRSTFLIKPNSDSDIEFTQYFARGNDNKEKYKKLSDSLSRNERDFTIEERRVRLLLCGENNYFKNERYNAEEDNQVHIRYGDLFWDSNYDILINSAHTTMGQWNLLNQRFSKLSDQNKIVVYTTNKGRINCEDNKELVPVNSWSTALRVYKNKDLFIDGKFQQEFGKIHIGGSWRMITLEV
jgi:hypothetical protein